MSPPAGKLVGRIPASDVPPGQMGKLPYKPHHVLVVNFGGYPYAIEDTCNHAAASLFEGHLEGCEVSCPAHGYVFDVRTGRLLVPEGLCDHQRTFYVEREGDDFVVYDTFVSPFSTPWSV